MAGPVGVPAPATVYRLARHDAALRHSRITPIDNRSGSSGNRYDVVGGGVLYAATEVRTCYSETLARFHPTPKMRELLRKADPDEPQFMLCGGIAQDWRLQRRVFALSLRASLPFLDVETPATLSYLEGELSSELLALDYAGNLDLSDVRNRDRRLSRAIAAWAYTAQDGTVRRRVFLVRHADESWRGRLVTDDRDTEGHEFDAQGRDQDPQAWRG